MMELILWRHAEAEDLAHGTHDDLARQLTPRGRKQAAQIAGWLRPRLPEEFTVIASPAVRTRATADALEVRYALNDRIAPGARAADVLAACGWPAGIESGGGTVVVVGHQPTLGRVASLLLSGTESGWSVRKGAIWWLSARERDAHRQAVLRAVISPELV